MTRSTWFDQTVVDARNANAVLGALWVGLAFAGLRELPRFSMVCQSLLAAAVLHVALCHPKPASLIRFFPGVVVIPYLGGFVLAALGIRAFGDRPEAGEAVSTVVALFLTLAHLAVLGRLLSSEQRGRGQVIANAVVGAAACVSLAALLAWRLLGASEDLFVAGTGALPAALTVVLFRRYRGERAGPELPAPQPEGRLALDQAARQIAHAMLKPIAAVSEQLRMLAPRLTDAQSRAEIEAAAELMGQLQRLVRDLLDLARAQGTPDRRRIGLAKLVEQAVAEARNRYREATIEVEVGEATLVADELGVRCLLVNLLENAIEAKPPGWVRVRGAREGDWLHIQVEDRGGGLPPEIEAHLFEPFATTKVRGTGLGLAVVSEVARAHGGRVEAQPADGGTRFVVALPASPV
jgi:signal transduction histidine kinase